MKVIILANGDQSRFPEDWPPKQLLEVEGVPVIVRMIEEFHEALKLPVLVATRNTTIIKRLAGLGSSGAAQFFDPGPTENQLATLATTESLWDERTLCLLGDVYYSDQAVAGISSCQWPVVFFGRRLRSAITGKPWGELVAMAWASEHNSKMLHSLREWQDRPLLWSPYRDFAGLWQYGPEYLLHKSPLLWEIDDWTDDFDTAEDYEWWKERWEKAKHEKGSDNQN